MAKRRRQSGDDELPTIDNEPRAEVATEEPPVEQPQEPEAPEQQLTIKEITIKIPVVEGLPVENRVYAERIDVRLADQCSARALESVVTALHLKGHLDSTYHQVNRLNAMRWLLDQVAAKL